MRIAMLGVKSVPTIGGISRYTEELGQRLAAHGHEVTVYCRNHYLDDPTCSPHLGIRRRTSPGLQGKYFDAASHTLTAAVDSLSRDYDIIHIHGLAPGFVAPLMRLLSRTPIVLTVHACDWKGAKWGKLASYCMRQASWGAVKYAHKVTAVSHGLQEHLRATRGCDAIYAPPGIPIADIMPASELFEHDIEPGSYILCVSRLVPEKGIHYAIEAFERLDTDKTLVIAGDCPYDSEYANSLIGHASDRVKFLGGVSGRLLEELYSHAYLFIQPSDLEGLPIAVLEALSYGRCVLASDIAPNKEALGGRGHTFRASDVDHLSAMIKWLIDSPTTVEAEFRPSRQHVWVNYNWDRTAALYEDIYAACLAERTSSQTVGSFGPARQQRLGGQTPSTG